MTHMGTAIFRKADISLLYSRSIIENMSDKTLNEVKDLLEIMNHRLEKVETIQAVAMGQIRIMKDQQSVMNKKLTALDQNYNELKQEVTNLNEKFENLSETVETIKGFILNIENTLEGYGDMYKVNQDYILRLQSPIQNVEKKNGIDAPEELIVPRFD